MKAMNNAGTMPMGLSFPLIQLIVGLGEKIESFVNFFADEEEKGKDDDDKFIDDLDDEDENIFGKEEDTEEEDEEEDEDKAKSKDKSAIHQKVKYRNLYKQTKSELDEAIKRLDAKDKEPANPDPAKAKQEKDARDYLRGLVEDVLNERSSKDDKFQRELDEQLEELLDDNDDLTEKQILEVVEELGVTPKQAVAAIRREQKANGLGKKAKPAVPRAKRSSESVSDSDKGKDKKPMTLEQAAEAAKKRLREMSH